jgi:hypothetical protein
LKVVPPVHEASIDTTLFGSFVFMAIRQRRGGRGVLQQLSAWSA